MASAKADKPLTQADVYSESAVMPSGGTKTATTHHNLNAKEIEMMNEMFSEETVLLINRMKAGRLLSEADRCGVREELLSKLKEIDQTLWERSHAENVRLQAITGEVVSLLEKNHFEFWEAQK